MYNSSGERQYGLQLVIKTMIVKDRGFLKHLLPSAGFFLYAILLAACDGDSNSAPTTAEINDLTINEDKQGQINFTVTDDSTKLEDLTLSIDDSEVIAFNITDNNLLEINPQENYHGASDFTLKATDSSGKSSSVSFSIIVNPVNDSPVLGEVNNVQFDEDMTSSVTLTATDIDSDDFTYSVSAGTEISAEREGNTITFTADANYNGSEQFTVEVTDDLGLSDSQVITVTVIAVNDAPVLGEVPDVQFDEDGQEIVTLTATDVDSDNLSFSVSSGDEITAERDGTSITFTADANYSGSEQFTVEVTDDLGSSDSQVITVTVIAVNDAPEISSILMMFLQLLKINYFNIKLLLRI